MSYTSPMSGSPNKTASRGDASRSTSRSELRATEKRSIEEVVSDFPITWAWAEAVFARLGRIADVPSGARVLDVGAAAGGFVITATQLGYHCSGVEPFPEARQRAAELSQRLGIAIDIVDGRAEAIPFDESTFDIVHASSVMEHVADLDRAIAEVHRVLKPGGIFWFNSTSALCPAQDEIRGFPLFGWYPNPLKRRIMLWALDHKPHLIGDTDTPAMHWFTPWMARRLLRRHGFGRIYDRWDLRGLNEGGGAYRAALKVIRTTSATKLLADLFVSGSSYAAIK